MIIIHINYQGQILILVFDLVDISIMWLLISKSTFNVSICDSISDHGIF